MVEVRFDADLYLYLAYSVWVRFLYLSALLLHLLRAVSTVFFHSIDS